MSNILTRKLNAWKVGALLLSMSTFASHSQILEYSGTLDETVKRVPAADIYLNSGTDIGITVSAGLDRRIVLTVTDDANNVVFNQTSQTVDGTDNITVNGNNYYGKVISVGNLNDGEYTLDAQVIDGSDNVLFTYQESLWVDTVAPRIDGDFYWDETSYYHRVHENGRWTISNAHAKDMGFTGVFDDGSGLGSANFRAFYFEGENAGQEFAQNNVANIVNNSTVRIGNGGNYSISFSNVDETLRAVYTVFDKAGNSTQAEEVVYLANGESSEPVPYAIYTGSSDNFGGFAGYEEYVPGMAIYENPVTMIYTVPADEYRGTGSQRGEIFGAWLYPLDPEYNYVLRVDGDTAFIEVSATSNGNTLPTSAIYTASPKTSREHTFSHDLTYGNEDVIPPVSVSIEAYVEGLGQWVSNEHITGKDTTGGLTDRITQIRITVEPRPYDQYYYDNFVRADQEYRRLRCDIPASQTQCTIDVSLPFPGDDFNVYHTRRVISQSDGPMVSNETRIYWFYNGRYADLVSHDIDFDAKTASISSSLPDMHKVWGVMEISKGDLIFVNRDNAQETRFVGEIESDAINESYVLEQVNSVDFSSITSGNYDVYVELESSRAIWSSNRATQRTLIESDITIDTVGPDVTFSISDNDSVAGLSDITVTASDNIDPSVTFTRVLLSGGPNNIAINISLRPEGDDFKLEYPVMFPSLSVDESYTLTIDSVDSNSNASTDSVSFLFEPARVSLRRSDSVVIPSITQSIQDNEGYSAIATVSLNDIDGNTVSGVSSVNATLSGDAQFSAVINNVLVNPGDTIMVADGYDFGANGGQLNLPIHPQNQGDTGSATILLAPSFPEAPIAVADVQLWEADIDFSAAQDQYNVGSDRININVSVNSDVCEETFAGVRTTPAQMFAQPKCLIEITDLPYWVEFSEMGSILTSNLIAANMLDIPYQVSFYTDSGDKILLDQGVFQPDFLVEANNITTFGLAKPLYYDNGDPVTAIRTGVISDGDGQRAQGNHLIRFTLSADAAYPVIIRGQTVQPGDTIELVEDLSGSDSQFNAFLYPAVDGVFGSADYTLTISKQ